MVPSGVTNLYYGNRSFPTLAQTSPTVGPKMCSHHNNYRNSWNAFRLASMVQLTNSLTSSIHHVSRWINPYLEYSCCHGSKDIGKSDEDWLLCRTTIVTFGNKVKQLGFVNTCHVDKRDRYKNSIQKDLNRYCLELPNGPLKHSLTSNLKVGVGKPTTCAYQFINHVDVNKDGEVYQYFLYDGFKIAIRVNDFACKTFYGHLASHRTALPLIVQDNNVFYRHCNVSVFAWGKS